MTMAILTIIRSICLPLLFKEENVFKILKPTEQYLFQETCNSYNFSNQTSKKEIFEDEVSLADPKLSLLLEILFTYPEINRVTKELMSNVSPKSRNLIEYLSQFIEIVDQRIRTSPAEERNYRLKLLSASTNLQKSKSELIPLQNNLEERRRKHHDLMKEVSEKVANYKSIIKDRQAEHEASIKKIISDSKFKMIGAYLKSREKQKALENQIADYKKQFVKVLQEYANREKSLRDLRLKSEKKHMASIIKYDTEIGSLHQTKVDLTEELQNLDMELKKLEEQFAVQEIIFRKMKEEKEALLMRSFAEQIENFSKNRAAKIIQRTWRAYHIRMMSMKKKKKSKRK
ncbi:dynein regulatory complex protein 10-like isoform X2 [Belonocnema kinseyi]|uniref:dynein regulatory complex protein 10-like isoform X2 n=1 Tax=Belonocnema kinseyi TaxID=2817044 RepID=UPI00143DFEF0|nr:dynein regulatory complex protein 10-like isoform X2 [Belonocnema kinseyi]